MRVKKFYSELPPTQVGTLHCTGSSDSQNPYSVPDDPSSGGLRRDTGNPRVYFPQPVPVPVNRDTVPIR
jgi:hypothetical protein